MNQEYTIRSAQVIRFRRWSNSSFAVFNSLGKVIQIGFLTKIIHGLTATSTDSKPIEVGEQLDRNTESSGKAWLELDVLKIMELLGLAAVLELVSDKNVASGRIPALDFQIFNTFYSRPFWGLLFYPGSETRALWFCFNTATK